MQANAKYETVIRKALLKTKASNLIGDKEPTLFINNIEELAFRMQKYKLKSGQKTPRTTRSQLIY